MTRDLGTLVPNWTPPPWPDGKPLDGAYVRLERFDPQMHGAEIHYANLEDSAGAIWNYLPYGPFETAPDYQSWAEATCTGNDPHFWAIYNKVAGRWCGVASYLRIKPESGSIEVGHINFAPALQKTPAATEAMFLLMQWAFEAGYRRYEWKCNALNQGSRAAAQRLGLSYEGIFRQATISKGRNRDTAWFAAIDSEWPALKTAFEAWLAPENFDAFGVQKKSLSALTAPVLVAKDPLWA